ncbi:hypothetical protein GCM10018793_28730 [Streptomyces sulfonofaciens]|uniref:Uncharacterized protein n=1 Tax=Streptomyces sulfonofaciens TaxID=68272 RepID=A0A919L013_9ACTN|nr:hypothetical protein [Streptomyces sulfonofaciens]GHH78384.1 hypothetical protein GCM10018793_28730 [Streptomyces sulfonofaciens]
MFCGELQVDPPWTFELAEILNDRRIATEGKELGLTAALDQLESWLDEPREYHKRHRLAWLAAIDDYDFAVQATGPAYRRGLSGHLGAVRRAMAGLPAKDADQQRARALTALRALARAASSGDQLGRAWADVVDAVRGDETYAVICARIALLQNLLERTGRRSSDVTRRLVGVLRDRRVDVQMARLALGDIEEPGPLSPREVTAGAGVAEAERLSLCARTVVTPPRQARHVVWHAFAKARLAGMVQSFGPITLYDREWFMGNAAAGGPFRSRLPPEVANQDSFFPTESFPDEPHVVLARVDLGTDAYANAPAESSLQVRSMILASTFPEDRRGWEMYEGYIHTVDGAWAGTHAFRLAEEDFAMPYARMDATAERLSRMAPRIAPHLPGTGSDLAEVVDAIGWWKASGAQPPLPAIVLDVRILELLATRVAALDWYDYLDHFHKNAWIRHQVVDTLADVAWHSTDDLGHFTTDVRNAARDVRSRLVKHKGRDFDIDIREVISALPDLISVYPRHSRQRRRATGVAARLADGAGMRAWYESLEGRWSRSTRRLRAIRNSLAHGGPVTPEAATSVGSLVHFLAGTGLTDSLNALLEGAPHASTHELRRDTCDAWADRWLAGMPATETFQGAA